MIGSPPNIQLKNLEEHMVLVEGGTFMMGSEEWNDTLPHRVILDDFHLLRYPVTQSLWESVMNANPSEFPHPFKPVENVSWEDCQGFLEKLNKQSSYAYHLPTEAEWEFAARGGKYARQTRFPGSDMLSEVAWHNVGSSNSHDISQPVGLRRSNALGLFDMSGNVDEWCHDCYGGKYYEACAQKGKVLNPTGPKSGSSRLVRGGSWVNYDDYYFLPASRLDIVPVVRFNNLGFRLSRY